MADTFAEILNRKVEDAPRPKALPNGTYTTVVDGPYTTTKIGQDQKDVVDFKLKVIQVGDDVSPDEAAAFEGGLLGKNIRARFFVTNEALYRLSDFLEILGIDKGVDFKAALAQAPGKTVVVTLTQRPSPDGSTFYNDIKGYARV